MVPVARPHTGQVVTTGVRLHPPHHLTVQPRPLLLHPVPVSVLGEKLSTQLKRKPCIARYLFLRDLFAGDPYLVNVFLVEFAIFQSGLFEVVTAGDISQEEGGRDAVRSQLSCQHLLTVSLEAGNLNIVPSQ